MVIYKYLLLTPESLVVSMLEPRSFGAYLAAGTQKRAHEKAIYFDLRSDFANDYFNMDKGLSHCVPHPDGIPKRSVYVSTYRVLEHVPLDAIGSLWLATRDGRVLELKKGPLPSSFDSQYFLYQELCPVNPLIASTKNPIDFNCFITDPEVNISVPKICFLELQLGQLDNDPARAKTENLPYKRIDHLRDCILELANKGKTSKTVNRVPENDLHYHVIKSGFYVGDQKMLLYFPFPSVNELEREHHDWWRSATL